MRIWGVVFFLLISHLVAGQYLNLKFENFSTIHGLSSSTVTDVLQDAEGFMWFGTIDGLNKYNGYEFIVYRPVVDDPHSISSIRINGIEEDSNGRIWIATGNGLNVFDKKTEKFFRIPHDNGDTHLVNSNLINDLFYDRVTNTLWVATQNGVRKLSLNNVNLAQPQQVRFVHYTSDEHDPFTIDNNDVTSIIKDRDNQIWIGTTGKYLNHYRAASNDFERVLINITTPYALDHLPRILFIDRDGDFWIGNNMASLIVWNRKRNVFDQKSFADHTIPIFDIYQDRNGIIWIATDGDGIYFIDKTRGITEHVVHHESDPFSLSNNQPSRILEDRDSIVWIGTYNTGVNKLALSKSVFGHVFHEPGNAKGLSTKIAQSVFQDARGRIWIGTDGGGLNLYDEATGSFTHYRHDPKDPASLSSDKILYLTACYDGSIWVTTWDGGLNKFNPQTKKSIRYQHNPADPFTIGQNTVWCAVEDKQHRLWLCTQTSGLNLLDPVTGRFRRYMHHPQQPSSLMNNYVFSLFIDSKQRLLVGTSTGLDIVDLNKVTTSFPDDLTFRHIREKGLQGNRINYAIEDHQGNIWLGSDLGLHKLSADLKLLASYTTRQGLPSSLITGLEEDNNGMIWISTKSGLSMLDPGLNKFRNFNIHDGVQGMEFQSKSITKLSDGRILAGGINGFNIFRPEKIQTNDAKPHLFITDFRIFNRSVKANDTISKRVILDTSVQYTRDITLRYNENYLSFEYLALNYNNPEKTRYSYRMTGLDQDWNYAGDKRTATYSNLGPGDYTFEMRASLNGSWDDNKNSVSVNIHILPPPWRTWWAYSLYVIITVATAWFILRAYIRRVREEKERELDQMKLSFFINVSHEFRTPLTLILNPIEKILSSYTNPDEVKGAATTIQRSAHRLLNLVNQLLDFRKTDLGKSPLETVQGDIIRFSRDIFVQFNDLAAMKHIDFRFEAEEQSLQAWFDPDKIEKIITNLLSNALKFTEQGGSVVLTVNRAIFSPGRSILGKLKGRTNNECIELSVRDTGIGLKKEQLKQIFERFFHVDNSKTGTGIGLNFTKSLVELHHGEILVASEYGKGSTFTVRIPLDEKWYSQERQADNTTVLTNYNFDTNALKAMEYEMAISETGGDDDIIASGAGESGIEKRPVLLIVEDNRELRSHLRNELRGTFKIREAVNGADGLEKVLKYFPDIIISDIMMPEMDGFELCRRMKTNIETCHIPVILLTARSLEEDRIEGYQTGADEYLPKPFNIYVLKARLKNLLESRRRLREKFMATGPVLPASEVTTNTLDEAFLDKATKVILENISDPDFSLENLLEKVGISRSHFFRKINSLTGQNPSNFIRTVRLKYAAGLLLQQQHSIKEISFIAGFNSSAYFSKTFRELFGKTPQQYIEEHAKPVKVQGGH